MKKKFLFVTLFLLIALAPVCLWATPKISIPQSRYEFDSVPEGTVIKHSFIIKNEGDTPLLIEKVLTG